MFDGRFSDNSFCKDGTVKINEVFVEKMHRLVSHRPAWPAAGADPSSAGHRVDHDSQNTIQQRLTKCLTNSQYQRRKQAALANRMIRGISPQIGQLSDFSRITLIISRIVGQRSAALRCAAMQLATF